MAIITLKVSAKVTKAKKPVFTDDIAVGLAQRVEHLGSFYVEDSEGYRATVAIANVELVYGQGDLLAPEDLTQLPCLWCGVPVEQLGLGRAKLYCCDSHRQAAYRGRHSLA